MIGWKPSSIASPGAERSAARSPGSAVQGCSSGSGRLWEIHDDMNRTLQQEQTVRDENLRLRERRDKLNDPDEIAREAREQFGLAKPDEIPYKP